MATQGNDPVISQLSFSDLGGPCRTCEWSVVEHHVPCPFFHPRKGGAAIVPRSGDRRSAGKVGLMGKAVDQFQDGFNRSQPCCFWRRTRRATNMWSHLVLIQVWLFAALLPSC
jgi:hypothetical protein